MSKSGAFESSISSICESNSLNLVMCLAARAVGSVLKMRFVVKFSISDLLQHKVHVKQHASTK